MGAAERLLRMIRLMTNKYAFTRIIRVTRRVKRSTIIHCQILAETAGVK